jgi:predicted RNase H-like HicB family nuclease
LGFSIELEQEEDGRGIAEILEVPGVIAYGATEHEATVKAYAIALGAVADSVERSKEDPPASIQLVRAIA